MDRRLLGYYNRELQHLRGVAGEFAREFPKIAGRLALDDIACADPYVERLLEGFAFLSARVQLKLDAEFPRFTQSILETVYPHYLAPTPSMAVVQFSPDLASTALAEGAGIERGTVLRSVTGKHERTACEYRTAQGVTLWPIELTDAQYCTRELSTLDLPAAAASAKAGIRLRLRAASGIGFQKMKLDELSLFIRGSGDFPMHIYEQVLAHARGVVVQPVNRPAPWQEVLPASVVKSAAFGDDEALLPVGARSFQGYRLLHEYFAFHQRFLFF